jgi:hypothetical protein
MRLVLLIIAAVLGLLLLLLCLARVGLRVGPKPFSPYPGRTTAFKTADLPTDLPAPVSRFYKTIIGDQVPLIEPVIPCSTSTRGTSTALPD